MNPKNRNILIAGAAIAIFIAILAPFLASSNPDGLDKNLITLVGGGSKEKAKEIIEEKNKIAYEAPLSGYSIQGMDKSGKVIAILTGTVILLVLALGLSSLLKKKNGAKKA
jgi:cobalt/nickel transport protein